MNTPDPSAVSKWMESLGFLNVATYREKALWKKADMYLIDMDQAAYFYTQCQQAALKAQQALADRVYGALQFGTDNAVWKVIAEYIELPEDDTNLSNLGYDTPSHTAGEGKEK